MSSKSSRPRQKSAPAAGGATAASAAHAAFSLGLGWHQRGQLAQAQAQYRAALGHDPCHAPALHHLGILAYQSNNLAEALALMDQSLSIDANDASAHNNRGLVLQDMGRTAQALACFEHALALVPSYPDALNNRGNALSDLGRFADAVLSYEAALRLNPQYPQAHKNLGDALRAQGRRQAALESYDRALSLNPGYADALINRGNTLRELRQPRAALASYEQAVAADPRAAQGYNNLGNVQQELQQHAQALANYERAIAVRPDYARAYLNRGIVELALARTKEGIASLARACELDPELGEPRWAMAMACVAPLAQPQTDAPQAGDPFIQAIEALETWIFPAHADLAPNDVGTHQPFYIAYRDRNNREALARYGTLCARVMAHWRQQHPPAQSRRVTRDRLRIGIVSNHVHEHSVWNALLKGIVRHVDPARFELCMFSLGTLRDEQTALARKSAWAFIDDRWTLSEWVGAIADLAPDALLYPEIGMDAMTTRLASLRLAPVQLAAWGHPETTGLPTIDYYVTAADFEPAGCEAHYTEQVIALPGLGCAYQKLDTAPARIDLAGLGLTRDIPLLLCASVPFKYTPRFDAILVAIAKRLGACQFVFFDSPGSHALGTATRDRMRNTFAGAGLRFEDFARVIPWQTRPDFYALMAKSDVFLDTIGFSGFNTVMQAIECALPVVTLEGQFMRGRFGSAILRRIGLNDLVATSDAQYVDLAVELAGNPSRCREVRTHIEATRKTLFDDPSSVIALQEKIAALCTKGTPD